MTGSAHVELVDPRSYGGGEGPLVELAAATVAAERGARSRLMASVREAVATGDDAAIDASFAAAPGQRVRRVLLEALKAAIDDPAPDGDEGVLTRVFAIPVVFVVGGSPGTTVPGILPNVAAVSALLQRHGALGQTENFGLAATLVTSDALEALKPSVLHRWTRSIGNPDPGTRDLEGTAICVDAVEERAHLRFLVGAGVAPAEGVSFIESASRIGAWGMPVTNELAAQLWQEGLSLLPLPRPPKSIAVAVPAGRFALEETRFSLFVSRLLRRLRASIGEPVAVISAHAGGELRIALSSPFDRTVLHGFCWCLGPFDDLGEVAGSILSLLRDCRILDVRVVPGLQPDRDSAGAPRFLSIHDLGPSGEVRH